VIQADYVGIGVIALDALTRREWVKEDELANELKIHPKVFRRVLRYFEQVHGP
jgi:transcription initiation factor TFIIE subunit alpha